MKFTQDELQFIYEKCFTDRKETFHLGDAEYTELEKKLRPRYGHYTCPACEFTKTVVREQLELGKQGDQTYISGGLRALEIRDQIEQWVHTPDKPSKFFTIYKTQFSGEYVVQNTKGEQVYSHMLIENCAQFIYEQEKKNEK